MFAAYAKTAEEEPTSAVVTSETDISLSKKGWLNNSSFSLPAQFIAQVQGIPLPGESSGKQKKEVLPSPLGERHGGEVHIKKTPAGSPCSALIRSPASRSLSPANLVTLSSDDETSNERVRSRSSSSHSYDSKDSRSTQAEERRCRLTRSTSSLSHSSRDESEHRIKRSKYTRKIASTSTTSGDCTASKSRGYRSRSKDRRRHKSRSREYSMSTGRKKSKRRKSSKESKRHRDRSRDRNRRRRRSSSSEKHFTGRQSADHSIPSDDVMYEDRVKAFGNLKVDTLSRPAVPLYRLSRHTLGVKRASYVLSRKKVLKQRYYNRVLKEMEEQLKSKHNIFTLQNAAVVGEREKCVAEQNSYESHVEEELSQTTAKFNSDLASEPQNVQLWLKYASFQDVIHQFECTYRRGGGAAGARVTAERKLSILDKALEQNPGCEPLLRERCILAESVLPSDKLKSQLEEWTEKDTGNLVLWNALIMGTQGSLSTCRVPAVVALYKRALSNVHALRRSGPEACKLAEEKILDLLLHLGLFLRQAGLWELLWSLLHVYLEFNVAKLMSNKLDISSTIADNALTELEDAILDSQLPLPTLWLRVEMLRAGTHWVSLPADADSEDPQRVVFPEDVSELIHPINTPHLLFRLVTTTLILLKVPLLPWRETAARAAGLHPLPWLLDGPEPLYACLMQLGTLEFTQMSTVLRDAVQLVSGPQYLIARPGQDEYIDFLSQVFSCCANCLPPQQQTFIFVWWLRFYRWLMQLERLGHCKLPRGRRKKMRTEAKDLLRKDCNRNNVLLFCEFALLELESNGMDSAKKVLLGAIAAQPVSKPVPVSPHRAALCSLYRTLVELYLRPVQSSNRSGEESSESNITKERNNALALLVSLGSGLPVKDTKPSALEIKSALSKFHHVSLELLADPVSGETDEKLCADVCHLSPRFLVEWTACHAWLLFLEQSAWEAFTMLEAVLSKLTPEQSTVGEDTLDRDITKIPSTLIHQQRECVFEAYTALLRHHCYDTKASFATLRNVLLRALQEFPGNLTFVAAFADLEISSSGSGLPLWRLSKAFCDINSTFAHILLVFVMRHRLSQQEDAAHNTHPLLKQSGPEVVDPAVKSRMSTLLQKLSKHPLSRRCPLLWRLRMQFAAISTNNDQACHNAFYLALEECPWVKALYMDIVQVLPMQLAQVQDLLIEKELRLHVTPEELEILRPSS